MKYLLRFVLTLVPAVWTVTGGGVRAEEKKSEAKPAESKPAPAEEKATRTLGIIIFPGFELLDAYGPLEMWGNLKPQVRVVVIAKQKGEVASAQGPKTVAEYDFADCPHLDLMVNPGGAGV